MRCLKLTNAVRKSYCTVQPSAKAPSHSGFEMLISLSSRQVCACAYVHAGAVWMDFSDVRQWVRWGCVCEVVNVWWGLILPSVHYCWLRGRERRRDWVKIDSTNTRGDNSVSMLSCEQHYRGLTTPECMVKLGFKTVALYTVSCP